MSGVSQISLHSISPSADISSRGTYSPIPDLEDEPEAAAAEAAAGQEGETRVPPLSRFGTFLSNDFNRLSSRVALVLVIVILLALYGQRASELSHIQQVSKDGSLDVPVSGEDHLPRLRPCQFHRSSQMSGRPKVIQTSIAEPSAQWAEVSCFQSFDRVLNPLKMKFQLPSAEIKIQFQKQDTDRPPILGFGGAFTEATALNYNRLNGEGKKTLTELLFGKTGLGYRYVRTNVNRLFGYFSFLAKACFVTHSLDLLPLLPMLYILKSQHGTSAYQLV